MLRESKPLRCTPRVSLLVPARDEERNIGHCLEGLLRQDYGNLEILVLNDGSQDRTGDIVRAFCARDPRVKYVEGQLLPEGWTGKNWACHQLSREGTGDVLIFTDADNRHAPRVVSNTVGWIQQLGLGLFSAFPQQITGGLAEKLVIPVVDMLVYSGLPLWLTYYTRFPSLSAANGQWIAFTRSAYQRIGGHQAVYNQLVEDVELCRLAKRKGIRTLTAGGTDAVWGRMYRSAGEVWEGFSKNLFGLTGYQTGPFVIILLALLSACVLPYVMVWLPSLRAWGMLAVAFNLLLRLLLSVKYKHLILTSILLHPVGITFTILIGLNAFVLAQRGSVRWKGRTIDRPGRPSRDRGV